MTDKKTVDKISYQKDYYEKKKDYLHEEIECEQCGEKYKRYKKSIHEKTKMHLKKIEDIENKKDLLKIINDNHNEIIKRMDEIMKKIDKK